MKLTLVEMAIMSTLAILWGMFMFNLLTYAY